MFLQRCFFIISIPLHIFPLLYIDIANVAGMLETAFKVENGIFICEVFRSKFFKYFTFSSRYFRAYIKRFYLFSLDSHQFSRVVWTFDCLESLSRKTFISLYSVFCIQNSTPSGDFSPRRAALNSFSNSQTFPRKFSWEFSLMFNRQTCEVHGSPQV